MLLMTTSLTTESPPVQKNKLEPIPGYKWSTSFTCKVDSTFPDSEIVNYVFDAVQSGLDSKDVAKISDYEPEINFIRGICYYKKYMSALWRMNVYKSTNTTEGATQLVVEFQRTKGCRISFQSFYETLGRQKTILGLRNMKLEDAPALNEGFMQPLPPPPMVSGDEGEAPAPLSAEEQHLKDLEHMDEKAVEALHAWASNEMLDQRLEGLRAVVALTESMSTQDALVEKKMPLMRVMNQVPRSHLHLTRFLFYYVIIFFLNHSVSLLIMIFVFFFCIALVGRIVLRR